MRSPRGRMVLILRAVPPDHLNLYDQLRVGCPQWLSWDSQRKLIWSKFSCSCRCPKSQPSEVCECPTAAMEQLTNAARARLGQIGTGNRKEVAGDLKSTERPTISQRGSEACLWEARVSPSWKYPQMPPRAAHRLRKRTDWSGQSCDLTLLQAHRFVSSNCAVPPRYLSSVLDFATWETSCAIECGGTPAV